MAQAGEHRSAQLVEAGEGQLHLGLDARGPGDPAPGRALGQVVQQRGLAHAGLASHDQHLALARVDAGQEPVQPRLLALPAPQFGPALTSCHECLIYWSDAVAATYRFQSTRGSLGTH
jgi:hypothetical protein